MKKLVSLVFFLSPFLWTSLTASAQEQEKPRLMVHLLDYLAKDYAGAVSDQSAVLSESEYAEQKEFADIILKNAGEVSELSSNPQFMTLVTQLKQNIDAPAPPATVVPAARALQNEVISLTKLRVAPAQWPDLKKGTELYAQLCTTCHGVTGDGKGPAGAGMDPAPANFLDPGMSQLSPLAAYNTIRMGVPGTGMASFAHLSEADSWALAFHVVALRHQKPATERNVDLTLLENVATLSDDKLLPLIQDNKELLSTLRTYFPDEKAGLAFALSQLEKSREAAGRSDWSGAESHLLKSYLEGVEPVESRLGASDKSVLETLETAYSDARASVSKKDNALVDESFPKVRAAIEQAESVLTGTVIDTRLAFVASVGILLREGFEAALIILALLSITRAAGSQSATNYVHAGWISAVLLGIASWFLLGYAYQISGAERELMEGVTSLVAVAVLLYMGLWLHQHSEIERWTRFIKEKVQHAMSTRNMFGLALISFLAVFREALETVLFLRVMWFDANQDGRVAMMSGLALTFIVIIGACWLVLRAGSRLPVKKVFRVSSYVASGLALILAGKGIRALQESGISPEHVLARIGSIEILGFYPTLETILFQTLTLIVMFLLWRRNTQPSIGR